MVGGGATGESTSLYFAEPMSHPVFSRESTFLEFDGASIYGAVSREALQDQAAQAA